VHSKIQNSRICYSAESEESGLLLWNGFSLILKKQAKVSKSYMIYCRSVCRGFTMEKWVVCKLNIKYLN